MMESNSFHFAGILEELKMKREQVLQLDGEVNHLSLLLIERDSELEAKLLQCQQLEGKLAKNCHDTKLVTDGLNLQIKSLQAEVNRLEGIVSDYAEKLRVIQMEKQCQSLKLAHFEKELKDIFEHGKAMRGCLMKVNTQQSNLFENLKLFNEKQSKIVETCEVTQSYAGRALKEAEEKWRMAQEMNASKAELEQKLCSAEARFQVRETTGGDGVMAVRKQMESLSDQLKKSKQREDKLRQDLQRERQEKLELDRRNEELLVKLSHFIPCIDQEANVL